MMLRKNSLLLAAAAAFVLMICVAGGCHSQQPAAAGGAASNGSASAGTAGASAPQLQTYTAPDQSASAGVPAGWQVTKGAETVIQMTGPQGETVFLGNTLVAHNGPFQAGQKGANGIDISMPYSASLPQKLGMIIQQNAVLAGKPAPQLTLNSATPIQLPPALGQCGRFVASSTGAQGAMKLMAVFCSLPLDSGGAYKNILLLAQAPAATAAQSAPIAQAIFRSYRIPGPWLQKKLAPHFAPAPASAMSSAAGAAMINRETIQSEASADNSANCFDLSVLRQTPTYELPRSCGGTKPD